MNCWIFKAKYRLKVNKYYVWWESFQRQSSAPDLLQTHSFGISPMRMKTTHHLKKKSLHQLKLISYFSLRGGRWNLDIKWNYSYECRKATPVQTKTICLYSPGTSRSSLIIPQLKLISDPRLSISPWQPRTMHCGLFKNPKHILWHLVQVTDGPVCQVEDSVGTRRRCRFDVEKQVKSGSQSLFQFLLRLISQLNSEIRKHDRTARFCNTPWLETARTWFVNLHKTLN